MEALQYGKYYHIYNRGNNQEDLFRINENYSYFLNLYEKHVQPVADTYAWVLMPNHFHFLVRIKNLTGFSNLSGLKPSHQYFSNLFNAYTKAFNKYFGRHGCLFERPFERKEITDEKYLKQLVIYIHNNPVHHGFVEYAKDYEWSSYSICISTDPTKLCRKEVIDWFDDLENFTYMHDKEKDKEGMEERLKI